LSERDDRIMSLLYNYGYTPKTYNINATNVYSNKTMLNSYFGTTSIQSMYPNIINFPELKEFERPLDRKQIFDLQFKWNLIPNNEFEAEGFNNWWDSPRYWTNISAREKLSEEFIREFKDRVNWHYISLTQKLSEGFIREFIEKLYVPALLLNSNKDNYSEELTTYLKLRYEKLKTFKKLCGKEAKITYVDELHDPSKYK